MSENKLEQFDAILGLQRAVDKCRRAGLNLYPQDRKGRSCLTVESTLVSFDCFEVVTVDDFDDSLLTLRSPS